MTLSKRIRSKLIKTGKHYAKHWDDECVCHLNEEETDICVPCDAYIALQDAVSEAEEIKSEQMTQGKESI